jgi:hypothetical protein
MAPPGENLHLRVCEMDLHSIAVEFDLMDPALPVRYFLDLRRQGRRYKAGEGGLGADRGRLPALDSHGFSPCGSAAEAARRDSALRIDR